MISSAWAYRSQWLPTGWTNHSLIRFLANTTCFLKPLYFKQSSFFLFLSLSFSLILVTLLSRSFKFMIVQKNHSTRPKKKIKLIHTYKPDPIHPTVTLPRPTTTITTNSVPSLRDASSIWPFRVQRSRVDLCSDLPGVFTSRRNLFRNLSSECIEGVA